MLSFQSIRVKRSPIKYQGCLKFTLCKALFTDAKFKASNKIYFGIKSYCLANNYIPQLFLLYMFVENGGPTHSTVVVTGIILIFCSKVESCVEFAVEYQTLIPILSLDETFLYLCH